MRFAINFPRYPVKTSWGAPGPQYGPWRLVWRRPGSGSVDENAAVISIGSDHFIGDDDAYRRTLLAAADAARSGDHLVTIGIEPYRGSYGPRVHSPRREVSRVQGNSTCSTLRNSGKSPIGNRLNVMWLQASISGTATTSRGGSNPSTRPSGDTHPALRFARPNSIRNGDGKRGKSHCRGIPEGRSDADRHRHH